MKKILLALLILVAFVSCKKELTDEYKINFFTDKTAMQISYNDYSGNYIDTIIKSNNYSVSFVSYRSKCIGIWIGQSGVEANHKIQIYRNNKLVLDSSLYSPQLVITYCK